MSLSIHIILNMIRLSLCTLVPLPFDVTLSEHVSEKGRVLLDVI